MTAIGHNSLVGMWKMLLCDKCWRTVNPKCLVPQPDNKFTQAKTQRYDERF